MNKEEKRKGEGERGRETTDTIKLSTFFQAHSTPKDKSHASHDTAHSTGQNAEDGACYSSLALKQYPERKHWRALVLRADHRTTPLSHTHLLWGAQKSELLPFWSLVVFYQTPPNTETLYLGPKHQLWTCTSNFPFISNGIPQEVKQVVSSSNTLIPHSRARWSKDTTVIFKYSKQHAYQQFSKCSFLSGIV